MNARASVLAAANPKMSQWDEKLTVVENIQMPHTLLSRYSYVLSTYYLSVNMNTSSCFRFDLIFLMLDPQDDAFDRRLATHLVSLYHQSKEMAEEENLVSLHVKCAAEGCGSCAVGIVVWCAVRLCTHCLGFNVYLQDMNTLRDYIAYARRFIQPKLAEEAAQALVQAYVGMSFPLLPPPVVYCSSLCRHEEGW